MRQALWFCFAFLSSLAAGQDCMTYVVVNAFNPKLSIDILTLTAEDLEARMDKTPLDIVSSEQKYTSRLLVLVEADGISNNADVAEAVDTVTRMSKQAPEGQPVAYGVFADRAVFTKGFLTNPEERATAISAVWEEAGSLGKRVAMFDALHQALQLFGPHQPGDALLLVGFPYDDKSHHSEGDIEKEFLKTGTRFMAMLREPMSRVSRDFQFNSHTAEKRMFDQLPLETGGAHTSFDAHFFGWGWRGYMLGIKVPDGQRKSKLAKWNLQFKGTASSIFKKSHLYFPEHLPPCSAPLGEEHGALQP
jgi:hypothetical protein